jgi:hypothetical protein
MEKRHGLLIGFAALLIAAICSFGSCGDGSGDGGYPLPALSGIITITSGGVPVITGMELTVSYSGSEDVSYQWNKDGTAIPGKIGTTYTPSEAGSYTVTVSAPNYESKTSTVITVTTEDTRPELEATITITTGSAPVTIVPPGCYLTANCNMSGVYFRWNKDGTPISDATSKNYTPSEVGSYTVTVNIDNQNYKSKTSSPVTVVTTLETGPSGGKVFYHSDTGFIINGVLCHDLEAAPEDISGSFAWVTSAYRYTLVATQMDVGTGYANTQAILAVDSNAPAAKACKDYRGGGKDDWFLPSSHELNMLCVNKAAIGGFSVGTGVSYYSSSENSDGSVWVHIFDTSGSRSYTYDALSERKIRAVRAF